MAVELATAYVSLVPSFQGGASAISKAMGGPAQAAGVQAGRRFGGGFAGGVKKFGLIAGAGLAAVGVGLFKVGKTFHEVEKTIRVGTGATGKSLDGLVESAKNIGKNVPSNFADIGDAVADLNTRLGLTGKPLEELSGQFLNVSRLTGTDLKQNIAGVTRVFGDWGIATEDQAGTLDMLFRASQSTGAGFDTLQTQVVKFGAPMRQLGFSFDETLALLGKFEKEGVNTELVMGSMRIALGRMAREGEEPVETFRRVTEQIKNAGDAGEANALALELFGARAGPDMAAAIREGRFEIDDLVDTIANGGDTIDKASEDTHSFSESWQLFKNRALVVIEPIARRVFDLLGRGMQWINDVGAPAFGRLVQRVRPFAAALADRVVPAVKSFGGFLKDSVIPAVADFGGWLRRYQGWLLPLAAGIGAFVVGLKVYRGVVLVVTAVTKAWAAVQAALNAVMALNPIGLVVIALVALGAALFLAWKRSETFRDIVKKVWASFQRFVSAAWKVVKAVFDFILAYYKFLWRAAVAMKDGVVKAWRLLRDGVGAVWRWIKRNVFDRVVAAFKWVREKARDFKDAVVDRFRSLRDGLRGIYQSIKEKVFDKIVERFRWVRTKFGEIRAKVLDLFRKMRDGVGKIFEAMFEKIKAPLRSAFKWINRNLIKNLNKVTTKFGLTIPQLPEKFHSGGVVGGKGERIITALGGEGVLSHKGMQALGGKKNLDLLNKGGASGGFIDFIKEKVSSVGAAISGWLKKGAAFALDKIMSVAIAASSVIPAKFARDFTAGTLRTLRPKVKAWGEGKDSLADDTSAGASGPPVATSGWARPLRSGYRLGRGSRAHGYPAQDFPAPTGTPIFAPVAARVIQSLNSAVSYGNRVMMSSPAGRIVLAHMSRRVAQLNDVVRAGQLVGYVGSTGNSTGPHLHLEIGRNDPLSFLRSRGVQMDSGGTLAPGWNPVYNGTGGPETLRRVGLAQKLGARLPILLELRGDGSRRADFLLTELRQMIRTRGGDVQVVLGR